MVKGNWIGKRSQPAAQPKQPGKPGRLCHPEEEIVSRSAIRSRLAANRQSHRIQCADRKSSGAMGQQQMITLSQMKWRMRRGATENISASQAGNPHL